MKKLLTILATIGLTATTGTTVVSCATKKIEITFKDFTSVTNSTWIGEDFGAFYQDDLVFANNLATIKNKEKMAAYVAAGFINSAAAYQKIIDDKTTIVVYYKNKSTGGFATNLEESDFAKRSQDLFFQLTDLSTKKSNYLKLNFVPNQDVTNPNKVFNLEDWVNENSAGFSINVKNDVEAKLADTGDDEEKESRKDDLDLMINLKMEIVNAWTAIKNNLTLPLNEVDQAINAVFNYLGEYLMRIQGYVSAYSDSEKSVSIKEQLKTALNQNREWKDQTRKNIYHDWQEVGNIHNGEPLPFRFNLFGQEITINFDFSDK